MSWQKFDDRARESRKVRRATPEAITLWWAVGNWCCEHKTDGFIAKDELPDAWRPVGYRFDHAAAARACVDVGLLIDHGDQLEVHDFLEFNPSKEESDLRKNEAAKRARAYRARLRALKNGEDPASVTLYVTQRDERERHADDVTRDPSTTRHAPSVPSRPVPSRSEFSDTSAGADPFELESPDPKKPDPKKLAEAAAVQAVFDHWVRVMGKDRSKLDESKAKKIRARLREGFSVDDLKTAIDGCRSSPHHMGQNDTGTPYNSVVSVFKDGTRVEEHVERARRARPNGNGASHRSQPSLDAWLKEGPS